ncbi:MAG: hypothetical protein CMI52_04070 [Parcubacteria group bacterium]|nr:hypothetical protein [Parcubacteria group bacterium]
MGIRFFVCFFASFAIVLLGCATASTQVSSEPHDKPLTAQDLDSAYSGFQDEANDTKFHVLDQILYAAEGRYANFLVNLTKLRSKFSALQLKSSDAVLRQKVDTHLADQLDPLIHLLVQYKKTVFKLRLAVTASRSRWLKDRYKFANEDGRRILFGDIDLIVESVKDLDGAVRLKSREHTRALPPVLRNVCRVGVSVGFESSLCEYFNKQQLTN